MGIQDPVMNNADESRENRCKYLWSMPPDPAESFFSTINELNNSARLLCLIASSAHIGLFDALEEWKTEEELASCILVKYSLSDIIEALVQSGLVFTQDGRYKNSPMISTFLSRTSPYYQGAYLDKMYRHFRDLWSDLPGLLRNGPKQYNEEEFYSKYSLPSMAQNAMCGRLQQVIQAIAGLSEFSGMKKMIDLGGGHGLYAIALACKNPLLQAIVFDLPGVVHLAEQNITYYGLNDRVQTVGGNFFTDSFGSDYDLILSSSNPSGKSIEMVKKISQALKPGGFFVNIQPGDDSSVPEPLNDLEFSLWTFDEVKVPKTSWSKNKKFLTEEYISTLLKNRLTIESITRVSDPYIKDYYVTMLIAKKERD